MSRPYNPKLVLFGIINAKISNLNARNSAKFRAESFCFMNLKDSLKSPQPDWGTTTQSMRKNGPIYLRYRAISTEVAFSSGSGVAKKLMSLVVLSIFESRCDTYQLYPSYYLSLRWR